MWEFDDQVHGGPNALSEWVNISALDPVVNYCGVAWLTASSNSQFSFDLVDCDGTTEAYRLCYREPKNCSATSQPNGILQFLLRHSFFKPIHCNVVSRKKRTFAVKNGSKT